MAEIKAGRRASRAAETRRQIAALPATHYPTVVELADELADDDPDELFAFLVRTWIDAIARLAISD